MSQFRYFRIKAEEWDGDSTSYYDRVLELEVDRAGKIVEVKEIDS